MIPLGAEPNGSDFLPSALSATAETNVHAPTNCCLMEFCWLRASFVGKLTIRARLIRNTLKSELCIVLSPVSERWRDLPVEQRTKFELVIVTLGRGHVADRS